MPVVQLMMLFNDISYLELWQPICSAEPYYLCNFSREHHLEVKVEDEFQKCGQIISEIFDEYILSTKRFKTSMFFF